MDPRRTSSSYCCLRENVHSALRRCRGTEAEPSRAEPRVSGAEGERSRGQDGHVSAAAEPKLDTIKCPAPGTNDSEPKAIIPATSRRPCHASARRSEIPVCIPRAGEVYSGVFFSKIWAMGDSDCAVVVCQTALRLCPPIHDSAVVLYAPIYMHTHKLANCHLPGHAPSPSGLAPWTCGVTTAKSAGRRVGDPASRLQERGVPGPRLRTLAGRRRGPSFCSSPYPPRHLVP